LTLRKPEGTAAVHHSCMNSAYVASYFDALHSVLEENKLLCEPELIWNMDETGCSLSHTPGKVCAKTGSKYLQQRVSGNRETITLLCAGNAAGVAIPPHVIVKGKTVKSLNSLKTADAPQGTKFSTSDSGWTKQGLALMWFKDHFIPNIGKKRPQVLIMDGHNSHNFTELIQAAIDNNVILVELPEHTSHWLQPWDKSVFGPFKKAYNAECNKLMSDNPGVTVSRNNFCSLMSAAWKSSVTPLNLRSGFRSTGIFPFNPAIIPEEAFQPNAVTQFVRTNPEASDATDTPTNALLTPAVNSPTGAASEALTQTDLLTEFTVDFEQCLNIQTLFEASSVVSNGSCTLNIEEDISNDVGTTSVVCPPDLALMAVELAAGADKVSSFKTWFDMKRGNEVKDPLYHTWRLYKNRLCEEKLNKISIEGATVAVMKEQDKGPTEEETAELLTEQHKELTEEEMAELVKLVIGVAQDRGPTEEETATKLVTEQDKGPMEKATVMIADQTVMGKDKQVTEAQTKISLVQSKGPPPQQDNAPGQEIYFPFSNSSSPNDTDADVLIYPVVTKKISLNPQNRPKPKYFILTSDEVLTAKTDMEKKKQECEKKKQENLLKKLKRPAASAESTMTVDADAKIEGVPPPKKDSKKLMAKRKIASKRQKRHQLGLPPALMRHFRKLH
jgi:hypothetical protein